MTAQYLEALDRANVVRLERAQLKREVKAGRPAPSILTEEIPDWLEKMPIVDLLAAVPRLPKKTIARFLQDTQLTEHRIIGHITVRQRYFLGALLSDWENRPKKRARTHRTISGVRRGKGV